MLVLYGVSRLPQGRAQRDGQILADAFFGRMPVWVCSAGLKGTLEAGKRLDQVRVPLHDAASLALAPCDVQGDRVESAPGLRGLVYVNAYVKPGVFRGCLGNGLPVAHSGRWRRVPAPAWESIPSWVVIETADGVRPLAYSAIDQLPLTAIMTASESGTAVPPLLTDLIASLTPISPLGSHRDARHA